MMSPGCTPNFLDGGIIIINEIHYIGVYIVLLLLLDVSPDKPSLLQWIVSQFLLYYLKSTIFSCCTERQPTPTRDALLPMCGFRWEELGAAAFLHMICCFCVLSLQSNTKEHQTLHMCHYI